MARTPDELGFSPTDRHPRVWAALMEIGMNGSYATVVSLVDGSTSLYLGSGGGVIGAAEQEAVRRASMGFLEAVEKDLDLFEPTHPLPLPAQGEVRFNTRTYEGDLSTAGSEQAIWQDEAHRLRAMYAAGQDVITELRPLLEHPQ